MRRITSATPNTYLHQAVRYFCDNAQAAVFLTATPVQLGSRDLFTLLNVLRPDLVIDRPSFEQMATPNGFINGAGRPLPRRGRRLAGRGPHLPWTAPHGPNGAACSCGSRLHSGTSAISWNRDRIEGADSSRPWCEVRSS